MRKIRLIFLSFVAITMMTSGNSFAKPGWGDCTGCHASPTVQEFSIPNTYDSLTFPIYSVVAHDTDPNKSSKAGVTGYMITESDTAPSAGDPGWTGTPPNNYTLDVPGIKTLYAWAKDTIGNVSASLSAVIEIVIPEPNQIPVADAGADQSVSEGDYVTLSGSNSSDPDGSIDDYYWEQTGGPTVALSDVNNISPSFAAPAVDLNGVALTFRLTVTDDAADESSDTCIVNVSWVNEAPSADAGADQTVDEGAVVFLDGSNSSDPDDGLASYMWREVGQPSVTLSDANTAKPSFTAPFVDMNSISLTFELTVTDRGGLKSTDTSVINVSWVNEAPTADAGTDQTVDEGDLVTLDASNSSDPDDGIASYLWTQVGTISGNSVTLSDPMAAKPSFTAPAAGAEGASLTFQVTVTDKDGLKSTDTCIVNINAIENTPVNEAPTADAGADQTVDEEDIVTLDASNSSDPDDGIKSYMWAQIGMVSGVSVTLSDPAAVQPTFEGPLVGAAGASMTFQVTVTDFGGLQSSDTCIVNINAVDHTPANQAPTANAGVDQIVAEGNMVTLDGSNSSDPEGVIASYMWKQTEGMGVTLSDPTAAKPTFECPAVGQQGASLAFQVTVTDIDGLQATDTCMVMIKAPVIPEDDETPAGDTQEKLIAVRDDLMAEAKDREFSRRTRWMFGYSVKKLNNATKYLEKRRIKDALEEVGKAIKLIKWASKMERRNSELKAMCKEFNQDLEMLKAEIKAEVNNHDNEPDDNDDRDQPYDRDDDGDDDRRHDDDGDDDDDDDEEEDDDDDDDD